MHVAILLHLPDDAERFEPVARRLDGAELLLGTGRWAPAVKDSRAATRRWLRRRGWTALEQPRPRFDLILATACGAPAAVARWLAPGGRVVLWHQSRVRSRFLLAAGTDTKSASRSWRIDPVVARLCAAWPDEVENLEADRVQVTGDPRWDPIVDPAAGARARHALGLGGGRPVTLVLLDQVLLRPAWTAALASLRADTDVVLRMTTADWLECRTAWPRALTGPGLRVSEPDDALGLGELLALADTVIAAPGAHAHAAVMAGKRTLLIAETAAVLGEEPARRPTSDGILADRPSCADPGRLRRVFEELHAIPAPPRSAALDGRAAQRLADVIGGLRGRRVAPATSSRP